MRRSKSKRKRKGIYILPSIFTSLSIFCGFYAVTSSIKGNFLYASWAIILAAAFDAIDGRIARLTLSTSRFGVYYDSLADVISFGVAPGLLLYNWALQPFGRWGWLAAFLYIICVALRLARFNVHSNSSENKYFQGLPCPPSAVMVAITVISFSNLEIIELKNITIPLLTCLLALLMVSTIKYHTFKEFDFKKRMPFNVLVALIFLLIVFFGEPNILLFTGTALYTLSGPVGFLLAKRRKRLYPKVAEETGRFNKYKKEEDLLG